MSRASESRAATARVAIGGEYAGELAIDTSALPANVDAVWIRESCLGERDRANLQSAMRRGFRPATTDMLPQEAEALFPGDVADPHKLIRRGGSILMVRPRELATEERAFVQREDAARKAASARLDIKEDDNFHEDRRNRVTERSDVGNVEIPAEKRARGSDRFRDA